MTDTILHDYWRSSAAYRVRIALGLAGVAARHVPIDLTTGAQRAPEYLRRNPQGLVPTLEIDGQHLTQSLAIIEYLDETRAPGFLPADTAGRARVRAMAHAIAMEIHPICNLRVTQMTVQASGGAITVEDWMQMHIAPGLAAFERMLDHPDTGRFCHGDSVTMADICLMPQVYNAHRWNIGLGAMPRLAEIAQRLDALPAIRVAHPDHNRPQTAG